MVSCSIVIPTLREAANIGTLLAALQAQDYPGPVEIIVVDGGSDDDTPAIVQQFAGVQLLTLEPAGTSAQRNLGAQAATGELLVFMDADNRPAQGFLSGVTKAYARRPFDVACPWFVADSYHPAIRLIYFVFNLLFWLSQWRFHTGSGVCIIVRRETFLHIGGFAEWLHLGEDIHLIRRAAAGGRHRHLAVPLHASARRFQKFGIWNMVRFYTRISPLLLTGDFQALKSIPYAAAPYTAASDYTP